MATMLNQRKRSRRAHQPETDRGSVMVMSAIISVVVFALAAVMLSFADRESTASNGDRDRQHAIDAAMAGAVVANSGLTNNAAYAGTGLVTLPDGAAQFEVSVTPDTTVAGFRRILTSHGYAPSKASPKSTRTVRQVVELDPLTFSYGVYAGINYGDGSASSLVGDMYAGGNITMGNSQDYIGNVTAFGGIATGSNQKITGTLRANGNVSVSSTSTNVYGSVYAGMNITTGGTVRDTAQAGGTIGCPTPKVQGACLQNSPPPPVPLERLPVFVWNPANYLPTVPAYMSGTQFISAAQSAAQGVQGVFYLSGSADFKKNEGLRLTGDTTIVVPSGNFTLPGTVSNNAAAGKGVQLVIVLLAGNLTASNNLTIPTTVSTLVYTVGNFDAKNSSTYTGVLYAGGNVILGAHSLITYAPVSAPGFDWTQANPQRFKIRNVSTRETTGS